MSHLLDRLRAAVAPQFAVRNELASGGMGVVFLADDPALRRRVAIKVLRPELATAAQAERFLQEARLLARLSHPNVVTVHTAGEAGGLFYYVMEYAEGETLADRLRGGPLDQNAVLALARDLLGGLVAIHAAGIVHRDLKPANVLLRADRALIGDFGIALVDATTSEETAPSPNAGTVAYMAPEQRLRLPATARSDQYAAAMVLYEAATGRRWEAGDQSPAAWQDVAVPLRAPLARALRADPGERWPNVAAMQVAIERPRRRLAWLGGLAVAGAAAGLLAWRAWRPPEPSAEIGATTIVIEAPTPADPLADSVAARLGYRLRQNNDFRVVAGPSPDGGITIALGVAESGDTVRIGARLSSRLTSTPIAVSVPAMRRPAWASQTDSLADAITEALYLDQVAADPWIPRNALPKSPAAIQAWFHGERAYNEARWDDALRAYNEATTLDSTCLLCEYRLNDVDSWLARGRDPDRVRRLLANAERFPPHYQALIRAYAEPWPARYDSIMSVPRRYRDFAIGAFAAGDEAFHRAAVRGRARTDALDNMLRAASLKPGFAPAWEHLAWLGLELGEESMVRGALDSLAKAPAASGFSAALHQALKLAQVWRFGPEQDAKQFTDRVLATPGLRQLPDLAAGARIMMTMGAPAAATYLGRRFASQADNPNLVLNGWWGVVFGEAALGRFEESVAAGRRLAAVRPDPATDLFLAEWAAVLSVLRGEAIPDSTRIRLAALAHEADSGSVRQRRLRWFQAVVDSMSPPALPLDPAADRFLAAVRAARAGQWQSALDQTADLHPLVPAPADPFLPLLVRVFRADWLERTGRPGAAAAELAGYRHLQLVDLPIGPPQAGEVDWATAPLVDWRRARLLGGDPAGAERCRALGSVARLWAGGAPAARARADSADAMIRTSCGATR